MTDVTCVAAQASCEMVDVGTDVPHLGTPSANQVCDDELLFSKHLKCLKKHGSQWVGYVDTKEQLQDFERDMTTIDLSYETESSRFRGQETQAKSRLVFSTKKGSIPITLSTPFRVVSHVIKGCIFGRGRHYVRNRAPEQYETDLQGDSFQPKRTKLENRGRMCAGKKKGCVAVMNIKEIELFPQYEMDIDHATSKSRKAAIRNVLARLIRDLEESPETVVRQRRVYVAVSGKDCHTEHDFGHPLGYYARVDKEVIERIHALVREGTSNVREVKGCLKTFVDDVLFADREKPPATCRAFYPTTKAIRNHIQTALRKRQSRAVEQQGAIVTMDDFHEVSSDAFSYEAASSATDSSDHPLISDNFVSSSMAEEIVYERESSEDSSSESPCHSDYSSECSFPGQRLWSSRRRFLAGLEKCKRLVERCEDIDRLKTTLEMIQACNRLLREEMSEDKGPKP